MNLLTPNGNLLTEADLVVLAQNSIAEKIYGKKVFVRNNQETQLHVLTRRPVLIGNDWYGIYTGGESALGKGAFGKAVLAQRMGDGAREPKWIVIKVLPQTKKSFSLQSVLREVQVMQAVSDS
jgi:hypothetical protein